MDTLQALVKNGLNEKEAKVYLALLELGTASAYSIAPKAGLKRPITYIVLEDLISKGLVSVVPREKKTLYTAESPTKLLSEARQRQELLQRFMPNMEAIYNAKKEKPQVQMFEGIEGVKLIYEKIYESGQALLFGTVKEIAKLDPEWLNKYLKRVKQHNIPIKDLLSIDEDSLSYSKSIERGTNYEIRFTPNGKSFPSDAAIFGDSVVFFSFRPILFSVMITSKDISQSMKVLHEMAWQNASLTML